MKKVNFIEAVEYAKRGKEVWIEFENQKHYLFYEKDTEFSSKYISVLTKNDYEKAKKEKQALIDDNCNNIEFYLNKWSFEDE